MGKPLQIIRTGDPENRVALSNVQIDQMISELAGLYLERFKAMRAGDHATLLALTNKIDTIKSHLGQI